MARLEGEQRQPDHVASMRKDVASSRLDAQAGKPLVTCPPPVCFMSLVAAASLTVDELF